MSLPPHVEQFPWKKIQAIWQERMAQKAPGPGPLCVELNIQDLHNPTRMSFTKWHSRQNLIDVHAAMQVWFERQRRADDEGIPNPRSNIQKTLRLLWDVRDDNERRTALLIAATAENALRSGRGSEAVRGIQRSALLALGSDLYWHHSSPTVMAVSPQWRKDADPPGLVDMVTALQAMANEYADMLQHWVAVRWTFSRNMDPLCAAEMERREKAHERQRIVRGKQEALNLRRSERREDVLKRGSPVDGDTLKPGGLRTLERDELTRLVWSRPTQEVSALLGVSDVAVAKRCCLLEVPKPPKGFWNKVSSGRLPHPNGVPVQNAELLSRGRGARRRR